MADQSTQSIVIDADPDAILAVVADFPSYPKWAAAVKSAEVIESFPDGKAKQVTFTIDAGVFKDTYTLEYDWSVTDQVSWTLLKGQIQKAQQGSYRLEATESPEATDVTYSLSVDLSIPMLGMFKRKAEKVIMDTALKELKKRVEG